MASDPAVDAALAALAPAGVRTGSRLISPGDVAALHEVELAAVARAVDVRRSEFATGRVLLRGLLDDLDVAIPVGATRAPVLPDGVRASLAHDRTMAVAALTTDPSITALGIDVEDDAPLEADVAAIVLRPDESGLDAHLVFCLKEAAYKAWSTLGGRLLEHHDVRVEVAGDRFAALLDGAMQLDGTFAHVPGRWLALVVANRP